MPGKVFARIIFDRDGHHLFENQCPEQSGFRPKKKSTIDRILALRVLTECRREFRQGLFAVYVHLKTFDSVNRDALWRILGLRGVPPKLINLVSELHSGTESAARCDDTISDILHLRHRR